MATQENNSIKYSCPEIKSLGHSLCIIDLVDFLTYHIFKVSNNAEMKDKHSKQ
jgi:hypothetical protein